MFFFFGVDVCLSSTLIFELLDVREVLTDDRELLDERLDGTTDSACVVEEDDDELASDGLADDDDSCLEVCLCVVLVIGKG